MILDDCLEKTHESLVGKIYENAVMPVVVASDADEALLVANAINNAGIKCIEITYRTSAATEAIKLIKKEIPDMCVGAGTIRCIAQLKEAVNAGAEYIITPGYNEAVVTYCVENGIFIIPGCMDTASIEKAVSQGLHILKFFPAEYIGGTKMLKALIEPYSDVKFMPTGGINEKNIESYLGLDNVIACGGSWMVSEKLIKNKAYNEIEKLSRKALCMCKAVRLRKKK